MLDKIIKVIAECLEVDVFEIDENTLIYLEYDLDDIAIEEIIEALNEALEVEIDKCEFEELDTIQDITEYIEGIAC